MLQLLLPADLLVVHAHAVADGCDLVEDAAAAVGDSALLVVHAHAVADACDLVGVAADAVAALPSCW